MSDKNINKIMQFVAMAWAERHYDDVVGSPFKGLQIDIKQRARDDRDPFTIEQLRAIVNAPIYRGCRSASKWKHVGNEVLRDSGQYWVPRISLFSGVRLVGPSLDARGHSHDRTSDGEPQLVVEQE